MALIEVKVPDIGDFKDVAVIELLVKAGDTVAAEQSLVTVESDKASMEIPSSHAGVVRQLLVKLGDKVAKGLHGGGHLGGVVRVVIDHQRPVQGADALPAAARCKCWCPTSATSTRFR